MTSSTYHFANPKNIMAIYAPNQQNSLNKVIHVDVTHASLEYLDQAEKALQSGLPHQSAPQGKPFDNRIPLAAGACLYGSMTAGGTYATVNDIFYPLYSPYTPMPGAPTLEGFGDFLKSPEMVAFYVAGLTIFCTFAAVKCFKDFKKNKQALLAPSYLETVIAERRASLCTMAPQPAVG